MERVLRALPFVFSRTENDCWVGTKGEVILQYIYIYIYICTYIYINLSMASARKITKRLG